MLFNVLCVLIIEFNSTFCLITNKIFQSKISLIHYTEQTDVEYFLM